MTSNVPQTSGVPLREGKYTGRNCFWTLSRTPEGEPRAVCRSKREGIGHERGGRFCISKKWILQDCLVAEWGDTESHREKESGFWETITSYSTYGTGEERGPILRESQSPSEKKKACC